MNEYFEKMNNEYAQKHFPEGSVFESASKTLKKRGVAGIFFIGLFAAAGLWGLVWAIGKTIGYISRGESDMLGVSIFFCAIFAAVGLGFLALLIYMIKAMNRKRSDYVALSAKHSKLPASEIEEFDRQAMASDCLVLKLTKGLDRALSNSTNKDGLLTRDYIYLADPAQTVFRVDSLKACCFTDYTYYVTVGNRSKTVHNLAIYLLGANGVSVRSDVTEQAGKALMDTLLERNGSMDTNGGNVVPEGDVDDYTKRILKKA